MIRMRIPGPLTQQSVCLSVFDATQDSLSLRTEDHYLTIYVRCRFFWWAPSSFDYLSIHDARGARGAHGARGARGSRDARGDRDDLDDLECHVFPDSRDFRNCRFFPDFQKNYCEQELNVHSISLIDIHTPLVAYNMDRYRAE